MKVIAINGSPKTNGNTHTALALVGEQLQKEGIEFEIIQVGNKLIRGCMACGACAKNLNEKCIYDDEVNACLQKLKTADGILLGAPVHYAGIAGTMKSFLDRLFYVAGVNGGLFRHKVGASVVAVRRSGGVPTFVPQLDAVQVGKEAGLPVAPIMVYGEDCTHIATEHQQKFSGA